MKQTAVEWLEERLTLSFGDELKSVRGLLVIATEMEKEQMIDFARTIIIDATCSVEGYVTTEKDIDEYYNETFNINDRHHKM